MYEVTNITTTEMNCFNGLTCNPIHVFDNNPIVYWRGKHIGNGFFTRNANKHNEKLVACSVLIYYFSKCWLIVKLILRITRSKNLKQKNSIFIPENAFQQVNSKKANILLWPRVHTAEIIGVLSNLPSGDHRPLVNVNELCHICIPGETLKFAMLHKTHNIWHPWQLLFIKTLAYSYSVT